MAIKWEYRKIEDIAEKVGMGPFGSSIKVETFVPDGIPIISGQHLHGFRLEEDEGFNFITEEHATKLKSANVFRGDVIFTHAGNIENLAYIAKSGEIAHRIRFMSHTESGLCRTVRSEESAGIGIVPQLFGMERTDLSFR